MLRQRNMRAFHFFHIPLVFVEFVITGFCDHVSSPSGEASCKLLYAFTSPNVTQTGTHSVVRVVPSRHTELVE